MSYNPFYNIDNPELMGYEYAWIRFMKNGIIDSDIMAEPITESWKRCKQTGLVFDEAKLTAPDISYIENEHAVFLKEHGYTLFKGIMETIGDNYFYGIITDAHGKKIVGVRNERSHLPESLEKICTIHDFSEYAAGTNGFSIVSQVKKPFCVAGAQHFFEHFHDYASYAAPIIDLNGDILGIVGLYTATENMDDYVLQFVVAIEKAIENNLRWFNSQSEAIRQTEEKQYILDAVSDGVVYVDFENRITHGNRKFLELFGLTAEHAKGKSISFLKTEPSIERLERIGYSTRDFNRDTKVSIFNSKNPHISREAFFNKYKIVDSDERDQNEIWTFAVYSDIKRRAIKLSQGNSKGTFFFDDIKGTSKNIQLAKELARKAADFETRVIIEGDSGTGKEMFAQAIHNEGPRKNGPFVAVDCGALPQGLLESELFGYEEGAYTGAKRGGKKGKFELADKGVLFLDEITNMPLVMQAKLLRILQEGKLVPVGGTKQITFDVQVIAATNKDIIQEIEKGNFRKDLFYRLNLIHIKVPPLKERENDIRLFLDYFLRKYDPEGRKRLSYETIEILTKYDWPGNVRQLENVIERMIILSDGPVIETANIPEEITRGVTGTVSDPRPLSLGENKTLEEVCRQHVRGVVEHCGGNVKKASEKLGISRVTVYKYLKDDDSGPHEQGGAR